MGGGASFRMTATLNQPPIEDGARNQSFPPNSGGEAGSLSLNLENTSLGSRNRQASESQSSRLASSCIGTLAVERELLEQELSQLRAETTSLRECVALLSSECKRSFQKLQESNAQMQLSQQKLQQDQEQGQGEFLAQLPKKNAKKQERKRSNN